MIGGLLKSTTCRLALLAAAGLFAGGLAVPSAQAADLGGDCCADLEERVAELEATTARKGNRKMSLTVSGQVTRSIMYWNDSYDSDTYAGLDNHNQSTRFVFSGSAKINPTLTAGFEFMTELSGGARTSTVTQIDEDGTIAGDGTLNVRTANWWLEDKSLGRVTVGRINFGGPVGTIDLGGISTAAHFAPTLNGGSFFVANANGTLSTVQYSSLLGGVYGGDRGEGIRYDSPNIGGFLLQASWMEDDDWSASIRYAGDFSGFRIAAGIGYQHSEDFATPTTALAVPGTFSEVDKWAGSLAVMHTATGLFAQGYYAETATPSTAGKKDGKYWTVQAGITKNWFGLGNTSLFGEYAKAQDYAHLANPAASPGAPFVDPGASITSDEVVIWGAGVVQQIDAAAMELYLNWRRFTPEMTVGVVVQDLEPIDMITGGARIRF